MERCPICGTDTPCTTSGVRTRRMRKEPYIVYHCIECHIVWDPNRSRAWRPTARFNERDLVYRGLVPITVL